MLADYNKMEDASRIGRLTMTKYIYIYIYIHNEAEGLDRDYQPTQSRINQSSYISHLGFCLPTLQLKAQISRLYTGRNSLIL